MTIFELRAAIDREPARSAWRKGVKNYADELVDNIAGHISNNCSLDAEIPSSPPLDEMMLNGAKDWSQYSWGGCSYCYDYDIAKELCSPSELKKTRDGARKPNRDEEWLDVQARALYQAAQLVKRIIKREG